MRIAIVGGVERTEAAQRRLAEAHGHQLIFHPGHLAGRGARTLEALIDASDLVVVVTDVNSHGAVQLARKRLRLAGRTPVLLRRLGHSRFAQFLEALDRGVPATELSVAT